MFCGKQIAESLRLLLFMFIAIFLAIGAISVPVEDVHSQSAPSYPRTAFVHLFEWKWTDIAQECETFLGPKGFSAVQVSPPNEHAVVETSPGNFPWWERYQPVSYQIESRSGTRAEFIDMVQRCDAVDVDIYVDAVINHMTGGDDTTPATGIAGSTYTHYDYPGTYSSWDFNYCGRNGNNDIVNYGDRWEVQNCELVNLADLNTSSPYVQNTIAAYLQDLVDIGVAGFRIDASKHMDTNDINSILGKVTGDFYVFQEVIDLGGEPITGSEYFQNGDVTEFKYSRDISNTFFNGQLAWFNSSNQFGAGWGFMPSSEAVVFVDNHDNQRGHGGGGHIITHKDGTLYDLTNVFMLAWPYGYPKIMSSYEFSYGDEGPPSDNNGNTDTIYSNGTPNCFNEWKCEHRWQAIANMVEFRNVTSSDFTVDNWWSNGGNQIAFSRGDSGFVAINKEGYSMNQTLQTGMPAGEYCNVVYGELATNGQSCTGPSIVVDANGTAQVSLDSWNALAIHSESQVSSSSQNQIISTDFTVNATTYWGQNVYVVGNIAELGNWNAANAIALSPSNYPLWSHPIDLPASTAVEYKYIKIDGSNVVWESGSNRIITTPASGTLQLNDTWK